MKNLLSPKYSDIFWFNLYIGKPLLDKIKFSKSIFDVIYLLHSSSIFDVI